MNNIVLVLGTFSIEQLSMLKNSIGEFQIVSDQEQIYDTLVSHKDESTSYFVLLDAERSFEDELHALVPAITEGVQVISDSHREMTRYWNKREQVQDLVFWDVKPEFL